MKNTILAFLEENAGRTPDKTAVADEFRSLTWRGYLAAALRAADSIGVAAKTSGAGGGDCVIACVSSEMEEEAVKNLWIRIGVVPLESVE